MSEITIKVIISELQDQVGVELKPRYLKAQISERYFNDDHFDIDKHRFREGQHAPWTFDQIALDHIVNFYKKKFDNHRVISLQKISDKLGVTPDVIEPRIPESLKINHKIIKIEKKDYMIKSRNFLVYLADVIDEPTYMDELNQDFANEAENFKTEMLNRGDRHAKKDPLTNIDKRVKKIKEYFDDITSDAYKPNSNGLKLTYNMDIKPLLDKILDDVNQHQQLDQAYSKAAYSEFEMLETQIAVNKAFSDS